MKRLLKLCAFTLLIIAVIISCQKNYSEQPLDPDVKSEFTTLIAKKWYAEKFQTSAGARKAWSKGKKFPDWKNSIYQKKSGFEFLEYPLSKEKTRLLIRKDNSLTKTQVIQVFKASLSRALFIRNSKNEIVIREVDYIPDWNYLEKNQFDISKTCYGKPGDDFTGTMIVKDWDETILSIRILKDGKVIRKVSTKATDKNKGRQSNARLLERICVPVEYCMMLQDCEYRGDVPTGNCGKPYPDYSDCYTQDECTGEDEDPCYTYEIGCENPCNSCPPQPQEETCSMTEEEAQQALDVMTIEALNDISSTTGDESIDEFGIHRKPKNTSWKFLTLNMGIGYKPEFSVNFTGAVFKTDGPNDVWKWESFSYANVLHSGGEVLICNTVTPTATVSTIISNDKLNALIVLDATITATITCSPIAFKAKNFDHHTTKSFPSQ